MALHFRDAEALAARAWDVTKAEDEPVFAACSSEHRSKLINIVEDIVERGVGSGIAGLEHFEDYVRGVMPPDTDFADLAVAVPSDKFLAEATKRREDFNAKEADLLAKELDRVDAENEKKEAAKDAEEAKANAKVAAAIAADKPKPAAPKPTTPAPKPATPAPKPAVSTTATPAFSPKPATQPVKK
jgi:hypothetical protein